MFCMYLWVTCLKPGSISSSFSELKTALFQGFLHTRLLAELLLNNSRKLPAMSFWRPPGLWEEVSLTVNLSQGKRQLATYHYLRVLKASSWTKHTKTYMLPAKGLKCCPQHHMTLLSPSCLKMLNLLGPLARAQSSMK